MTVNGQVQQLFMLRDAMRTGTTFVRFGRTSGGNPLYHRRGDPELTYTSVAPPESADIDGVALGISSLAAGGAAVLDFLVRINSDAKTAIENTAEMVCLDATSSEQNVFASNSVHVLLTAVATRVNFYNAGYAKTVSMGPGNGTLYFQANAPGMAKDPAAVETITVIVKSARTGDHETFTASETAPGSDIFRVEIPTQSGGTSTAANGDGMIQTASNDTITAQVLGGGSAAAKVLIDPAGIVFDSKSNKPVAGAQVTLIDATTGAPALVFEAGGGRQAANSVTTTEDGRFQFPAVNPGIYRLEVKPPPGYLAPSKVRANGLPADRMIHPTASFGENFVVDASTGAVMADYPVDFIATDAVGLFIRKSASRETAEMGDFVDYMIEVKNVSDGPLKDVVVDDVLPFGFAYEKGTARSEGRRIADPTGRGGPRLRFAAGQLAKDETTNVTYRVRVGPGAKQGDATNRARAYNLGTPKATSNLARFKIELRDGVFTDRGIIIGKVFVDVNGNRVQDATRDPAGSGWATGEPGIPGIRLFLEDGTYVITDSEGKFSFYGIAPRLHVLKLDPATLPPGAKLESMSTRDGGYAATQWVDLKNAMMHKANFGVVPSPELLEYVAQRRSKAARAETEVQSNLETALPREGDAIINSDTKSLPASGIKGVGTAAYSNSGTVQREESLTTRVLGTQAQTFTGLGFNNAPANGAAATKSRFSGLFPDQPLNGNNSNLPGEPIGVQPTVNLEQTLTQDTASGLAIMDLKDGDTLPIPQTNVRVKGAAGATFGLYVNGREIPQMRVGKRVTVQDKGVQAWEFIGVDLRPGQNRIEATQKDPFGNERGRVGITVIAPDKLGQIRIRPSSPDASADGRTPVKIAVELVDDKGVPVTARTPLTLEANIGTWEVPDLNKTEGGTQVFIEGGRAEYVLMPPIEPGDCEIRVSSGVLRGRVIVTFLPELRPMLAAGLVEGRINLSRINPSAIVPTRANDGFEQELRSFAATGNDGGTSAAGRAAFFLKGKVKGNYLLTAAYDSEKDTKERLFRDIQPDEFYPVYGDSSVKGFDAQSSGRFYVRVDNRRCYLLYGDFQTQSATEARQLSNYNRSLNGVREHFENSRVSSNAWASYDSTKQVIEELPANGTSGPYQFRIAKGLVNSEKVEVLVRDRNQPSLVLKTTGASRFSDYEFEPFTGRILFKAPIPSLDENLNPVSIRVTYEADQGGENFWVYGADAQVKVHDRLELGGVIVREENPLDHFQLYGVNAAIDLGFKTILFGEFAHTDDEIEGGGNAMRIELRHQSENLAGRAYWTRADRGFLNPGANVTAGRMEAGAQAAWKIDRDTRLLLQAIDSEALDGGRRLGVETGIEYAFSKNVRLEIGGRYSTETTAPASATTAATAGTTPNEVRSARIKLTLPVPYLPTANFFGEWENDIVQLDKRTVSIGGNYQVDEKTKLYVKHELISSLGGPFELNNFQQQNNTVIGVESAYAKDAQLFNEFRARDSLNGPQTEAAIGLRNTWRLAEGLRANTSFERVAPIKGFNRNATNVNGDAAAPPTTVQAAPRLETTAITGALEYTGSEDWKATARLELRRSESEDSLLNTIGFATRLTDEWTFLGKSILYLSRSKAEETRETIGGGGIHGNGDRTQARVQAGLAYRPVQSDLWNALGKYEYKTEQDGTQVDLDLRRKVHILSLDVNLQPTADWSFGAHYAGKLAFENSNGQHSTYDAHYVTGRATYDINGSWDAALNVSAMFSSKGGSTHYGVSPEIGYTLKENLRVGVGYTFFGFSDPDLTTEEYTQGGVYLAVRWKFDEHLFSRRRKGGEQ